MSTISLAEVLFSRTRRNVFRELFANPEGSHLRELERSTGVNGRQLLRELHALRDAGILAAEKVGNLVVYRFNRQCPIYEDIQSLIRKTVGLADTLREMLGPFTEHVEIAYVFGSHARGDQHAGSDVDLMIVGTIARRQLSSAIRRTREILQREINATFYTPDEYGDALEDGNSFISRVHSGPRIDLVVDSKHEPGGHGPEKRDHA